MGSAVVPVQAESTSARSVRRGRRYKREETLNAKGRAPGVEGAATAARQPQRIGGRRRIASRSMACTIKKRWYGRAWVRLARKAIKPKNPDRPARRETSRAFS